MKAHPRPFVLDQEMEMRRRLRLRAVARRRRQALDAGKDVEIPPAPRCPDCRLLEPHVCVDRDEIASHRR